MAECDAITEPACHPQCCHGAMALNMAWLKESDICPILALMLKVMNYNLKKMCFKLHFYNHCLKLEMLSVHFHLIFSQTICTSL